MSERGIVLEAIELGHQMGAVLGVVGRLWHFKKGRHDSWLSRGAIDLYYGLMAAPFAIFIVPWSGS